MPVHVAVPGKTIYIKPSELERELIKHPIIKGQKWSHTLEFIILYNQSLNQCNARIERIWTSIDKGLNE